MDMLHDRTTHRFCVFETAMGHCALAWTERGIARFQLPTRTAEAAERLMRSRLSQAEPDVAPPTISDVIAAVRRYFDGEPIDFADAPLDLDDRDALSSSIYAKLRRVGWGRTTTYGALARELGAGPEAARDVGQAMARNPLPLLVPCHRVLAAGGKLGGFSAPGGAQTKRRMLELEGAVPPDDSPQRSLGF